MRSLCMNSILEIIFNSFTFNTIKIEVIVGVTRASGRQTCVYVERNCRKGENILEPLTRPKPATLRPSSAAGRGFVA